MRRKVARRFALLFGLTSLLCGAPGRPAGGDAALGFDGVDDHVTMGTAPGLDAMEFTLECWFRWDGGGTTASTGTGGVDLIPLIMKGRGEADGDDRDMNYGLGLLPPSHVLAADFEEHWLTGAGPGLNHPVTGSTPVSSGVWHHAAVTYDGSCWQLYLDGQAETPGTDCPGQPPNFESIQHFSLATALNSSGTRQGAFHGAIDEVRVWNRARTPEEIREDLNRPQPLSTVGLIGWYPLDENAGTTAGDSAAPAEDGLVVGATWVQGSPFDIDLPPDIPLPLSPPDGGSVSSPAVELTVHVADPEGAALDVTFYGRAVADPLPPDFSIVALPDTQYYSEDGPADTHFAAQTQWIADNRDALKIAFVTLLGDCVQNGDAGGPFEWNVPDAAFSLLEDSVGPGIYPDGIPFGIAVGNHDQSPVGDPGALGDGGATTTLFNTYFGTGRFQGRGYYGGSFEPGNNDNHFALFSAGGMDFVIVHLEFEPADSPLRQAALAWADGILSQYEDRRAIVVSHWIVNTGNPASFGNQGSAIYSALRHHPNLFLMLSGHVSGEGRRVDTFDGHDVHSLLSDYQGRANGGNGWLRILTFSPTDDEIHVRTYSPTLGQLETDDDSDFTIGYDMGAAFVELGTVGGVPSGTDTSWIWGGLSAGTDYEWKAVAEDGTRRTTGPVWSFATGNGCVDADTDSHCDTDDCDDLDADVWRAPGEVLELRFTDPSTIAWNAPTDPGGSLWVYDLIRSESPTGFSTAAICVASDEGSGSSAVDGPVPPAGGLYSYHARAKNGCPEGQGSLGSDSAAVERAGIDCP